MGICRPLLNQKHNVEWFLLRRFVDLFRTYFLPMISRNHSNTVKYCNKDYLFWCQDFDTFTQVVVHYLMSILMICQWAGGKILKIKNTFFTVHLRMTATGISRVYLVRIFSLFLWTNLFSSNGDIFFSLDQFEQPYTQQVIRNSFC